MTKSRTLRRAGAVALSLAMAMSIVGVTPASAAAKKVTLSKAKGTIQVGKTATVKIKGTKKANVKKVTFKYSKKNIVKATWKKKTSLKFTVKGLKKGTSTVKTTIQLKKKVGKKKKYTLKYVATVKKAAATPTAAPSAEPAGPTDLTGATQIVLSTDGTTLWVVTKDGKLVTVDLAKSNLTPDQIKAGGTFNLVDANGNAVTLTLTADEAAKIPSADKAPEVGAADVTIESAKQTKVDQFEVTFANVISATEDVDITITKSGASVAVDSVTWDATFKVATVKTAAKMTKGTYTITATSKKDATKTSSKDVVVDDAQRVVEIKILNDTALTKKDAGGALKTAYAYYDVLDQFGESMRASTSIQWSGSAKITANKTNGQLKLEKSDGNAWVYNDKIYVTGVYTKTGVAVSKELTVGSEQALDTIEMKGFVKKGTTEIIQALPKDFKGSTYYLLYNALDQNGNPMDPVASYDGETQVVTFVSDNVLVVKEVSAPVKTALVIGGVEYEAAFVEPGIRVSDGGEVTVTAIANKTGKKNTLKFAVGIDSVITSFSIGAPSGIVADGDSATIPFEAKDAQGNLITDFETIAKQETFNTLSLNASEGKLSLTQQADGSAKLVWTDKEMLWTDPQTTDGVDRPISLTSVVVGGSTDNEMLSVSDKRRPDAIADINIDDVHLEGAAFTYTLPGSFKFYDQYGEVIGTTWGADNGFFAADKAEQLKGNEFAGYHFGVRVINAGSGKVRFVNTDGLNNTDGNGKQVVIESTNTSSYATATDITSVASSEGFKFEIVKLDDTSYVTAANKKAEKWDAVSTNKFKSMSVVDISQVKNFSIDDLKTFYTGELDNTGDGVYGADAIDLKENTEKFSTITGGGLTDTTSYKQKVVVKGTYNGTSVTVPAAYYSVKGNKLATEVDGSEKLGQSIIDNVILYASAGDLGLKPADLYDKTSATGVSKLADDTLKATIYSIYPSTTTAVINYNKLKGDAADTVSNWTDAADTTAANAIFETGTITVGTAISEAVSTIETANAAITALKSAIPAVVNTNKTAIQGVFDGKVNNINTLMSAGSVSVYDTATKAVKISDQAPKATKIDGLKETYTIAPGTDIDAGPTQITNAILKAGLGAISVLDQYGVAMADALDNMSFKASNVAENKAGYADNNFKVSSNDTKTLAIEGAERGDTFDLVLTSGAATATTKVTVGADKTANITAADNNYLKVLIVELEKQRKAGLS